MQVLSADSPQPITGNSVRETGAKIVQAVGMDYDTFINSAFLLQGRAGEFTGKTPAERKAVLARIMGLEAYDRLQTKARERLSGAQTAAAEVEGALARMREDLEHAGDPSGQLAEVQASRAQTGPSACGAAAYCRRTPGQGGGTAAPAGRPHIS